MILSGLIPKEGVEASERRHVVIRDIVKLAVVLVCVVIFFGLVIHIRNVRHQEALDQFKTVAGTTEVMIVSEGSDVYELLVAGKPALGTCDEGLRGIHKCTLWYPVKPN